MKKVFLLLLLPMGLNGLNGVDNSPTIKTEIPTILPPSPTPMSKLVNALIYVESRGKADAIGDTHLGKPSIGVLQIRPIMVREANRILKLNKSKKVYKLKDRFSREKSIEIFMVWKNHFHPKDKFETIARNWNGGPRGYKRNSTKHYWVKVQKALKN